MYACSLYETISHILIHPTGGGKFITADGKEAAYTLPAAPIHLPEDVLASDKMLDRDLQAITIDADCMDEDLKAALFDVSCCRLECAYVG
ncbi:hypothetical protein EON63_21055 [archaeon]|nr:MAG: hypothetical protein EON63_21055 [archaeon]